MNDYERIARVIRFLDEHHTEQPNLDRLADQAGLSPFHFHRLFSNWAGVTPKDFLQCLTLLHAKNLLREGHSVLDVSLEAGLSGPGRLHDLCVNLEAASPGEMKAGGTDWTLQLGLAESPFGFCLLAESPRGICHLSFMDLRDVEAAETLIREDWPGAKMEWNESMAETFVARIFKKSSLGKTGASLHLRALVHGTPFQIRVWRALLEIPRGKLTSYGRLAENVGHPKAARAVGTAVGQNPLSFIIPCHRVIRETGVMGNYRWGPTRKRAMLAWEATA